MKKVMLLCNAGMSSSMMAKKASEYLEKMDTIYMLILLPQPMPKTYLLIQTITWF